jgi:Winged helix-turn helix
MRPAAVARQLGVSKQSASRWHAAWTAGGPEALHSKGPSGLPPRLSDADLECLATALGHGAGAHGFTGEVWTLRRIAQVVEREFGCTTTWGICGRSCTSAWAGACSVGHPPSRQHPAVLGHHGHVVVGLGPIEPDEQPVSSP